VKVFECAHVVERSVVRIQVGINPTWAIRQFYETLRCLGSSSSKRFHFFKPSNNLLPFHSVAKASDIGIAKGISATDSLPVCVRAVDPALFGRPCIELFDAMLSGRFHQAKLRVLGEKHLIHLQDHRFKCSRFVSPS
jgi:hypothetical protein